MSFYFKAISIVLFVLAGCSQAPNKKPTTPTRDFQFAEYYDYYGPRDSAFYYYNRVVGNSQDTIEKSTAYFKMGLRQSEAGDFYSAQESLLSAIKSLDEDDPSHFGNLSAAYNTLGNATLALKNYDAAIHYYRLSSRFTVDNDPQLYILNNLGVAYQRKNDYHKAISVFDSAINRPTFDTSLKAKLISNLARTKWLADSTASVLPDFMKALNLRMAINDSAGINASYAHLSEYYEKTKPDSALYYAQKWFDLAERRANPTNKLEALEQLAKLSPVDKANQYLEQYIKLNDSLNEVRSADRNRYALIRFDAEKSKADNLVLQQQVSQQRLITVSTAVLTALVVGVLLFWTRARRRKIKRDAENAVREAKLKTSQRVHDVVANGLYRVMNELEHREQIDRDHLLNEIEDLYERSRDISYEHESSEVKDLHKEIYDLASSFVTDRTKVFFISDDELFWTRVSPSQGRQLELVLKELLVNMQKHSQATKVVIHFRQENGSGKIRYSDDGVGLPGDIEFGNGLRNTVNRIKSIKGEIIFDRNSEQGLSILIKFPFISEND